MEIIKNVRQKLWDDIVLNANGSTYFHTYEWSKIIELSFPNYSIATKAFVFDDGIIAILPLIQSKRFFGLRKSYISMVPGVYGGILSNGKLTPEQINDIYKAISKECSYLSIIGNPYLKQDMPAFLNADSMFTHVLDLEIGLDEIWKNYSKGHKRSINKAKRSEIFHRVAESVEDYVDYFKVYEDSLRRWGDNASSRYSFNFFENIYNMKSKNIKLHLAVVDGKTISGILMLYHRNHVVYWHGATLEDFFEYNPSKYLQNEVIIDSYENGYKYYDFNPSGGHKGVISFKEGFGAKKINFENYTLIKKNSSDKGK
jgi:hypothetical protein